ncbi:histone H1B-like [Pseudophryne corroboree]|uniref:histone H1B-like n=1 Tax=Pseudophryne corroboree TaxID=495146 RepID=UPI00308197D6
MAETAPAVAAVPPSEGAAKKKRQPKKAAGGAKKSGKSSGPSVSELILKAVAASKERSGVSLKKALAAGGYDVERNNSRIKVGVKGLVTKGTLTQVKGTGASGSFKLNKKQLESKKAAQKSLKPKKPAAKKVAKSPKKPKKAPSAAKSPNKVKKPAKAAAAKSPKKPKAVRPKKAAKSPAKKAAKPKAAKSPAKKAAKPKAARRPLSPRKLRPRSDGIEAAASLPCYPPKGSFQSHPSCPGRAVGAHGVNCWLPNQSVAEWFRPVYSDLGERRESPAPSAHTSRWLYRRQRS